MTGLATFAYLHPGTVAEVFATSRTDLLLHDITGRQRITSHDFGWFGRPCGSAGIPDGRNDIAATFLDKSSAEWLLMVDSDMAFRPDLLERLISSADPDKRPIMGALAFAIKTDGQTDWGSAHHRCQPTVYTFHELEDRVGFAPIFDYPRNQVVPTAATGAACILIHRSALETIRDHYGPVWFDTIRHPKGATFSEDLAFCIRAAGCGLPIHVDTSVKTGHYKGVVTYDEAFFDRQQAELARRAEADQPKNRAERRRRDRKAS